MSEVTECSLRILLVLNHSGREAQTLERIRSALLERDPACVVRTVEYRDPLFLPKALELEPHVVFTFPITAISTAAPFYLLKFLVSCHIVCYRREGVLVPGHKWGVESFTGYERYGVDLVDYELFWGHEMATSVGDELLRQQKLFSRQCIRVFGYPDYEVYSNGGGGNSDESPDVEGLSPVLSHRLGTLPRERTVLFVTGFHAADYSDDDVRRAGDLYDPTAENAQSAFEDACDCMRRTGRLRELWIREISLLAEQHRNLHILVKTHPIENIIHEQRDEDPYGSLRSYDNVYVIDEPVPVGPFLQRCSLLLHYGSTTAAEACLSGVPSVFVRSSEVLAGRTRHLQFFDSVFPSNIELEIGEVCTFVTSHLQRSVRFQRTAEMDEALERCFNFSFKRSYTPSADMARFLIGLIEEAPRAIGPNDPLFGRALRGSAHTSQALDWAVSKARDLVNRNHFSVALSAYLDNAMLVSELARIPVRDLHLLRAQCLTSLHRPSEANRALDVELAIDANNHRAMELRRQIEEAWD